MKIKVDVIVDIPSNIISKNIPRADRVTANEVMKDTDPFVPMDSGNLKSRTHVNGDEVIYPGPYAHYLHEGILYVSETGSAWAKKGQHKTATGRPLSFQKGQAHWVDASIAANLAKWVNTYKKEVTRG